MDIKPIETVYNGNKFRSRLEARWAVFFDAVKIRYEYENEGYECDDGTRYLPDFYLPDLGVHVEVKGNREGAWRELAKAAKMLKPGGAIKEILILSDLPSVNGEVWYFPSMYYSDITNRVETAWMFFLYDTHDDVAFLEYSHDRFAGPWEIMADGKWCSWVRKLSFQAISGDRLAEEKARYEVKEWTLFRDDVSVNAAFEKAKQARFEYGETPGIIGSTQCSQNVI